MTITIIQSDRQLAAEITVLAELREIILSGHMDEHVNVQTIARARIAGWNAAVEAAANMAGRYYEMWSCANGFEGHTAGAGVIESEIWALIDEEGKDDE